MSPTPPEGSRPLPTMQKIKGMQWQGCGPGMPGPYGVAWMSCGRRPAPRNVVKWDVGRPAPRPPRTFAVMRSPADCCRGRRPRRPRRGQDPSLRCKPLKGVQWQGCGPGMPGLFQVGEWLPVNGWRRKARQSPSGLASSASSPVRGAFCAGEARERSLPIRGGGREAGRTGSGSWRVAAR